MADPRARRRLWPRVLVLAAVVSGIGAVGAATVGLALYDRATEPDRSSPRIAVDEFADAFLNRQDDYRAQLYLCEGAVPPSDIADLRDQLSQQSEAGAGVHVVVGEMSTEPGFVQAELQIRRESGGTVRTELQVWRFAVVEQDGWRVCGAEPVPVLSPTTPPTAG